MANADPRVRTAGNLALGVAFVIFAIFFSNVLVGGPLSMRPFMGDVGEMLTLFFAVIFFVIGTICREAVNGNAGADPASSEAVLKEEASGKV